jgi:RsiW-degrading membrane proteinase PrsW (M82 family)
MGLELKTIIFGLILLMFLFFGIILFYDKAKKEPVKKLLYALFLGTLLFAITLILYTIMIATMNHLVVNGLVLIINIISILIIGIIVEISKYFFFYLLTIKNKDFDEIYDSLIYSLSMIFSFLLLIISFYIIIVKSSDMDIIRVFTIAPTQIFTMIIMGYYMTIAMFTKYKEKKKNALTKSILIPSAINCLMYTLLINQEIVRAYHISIYYLIVVISFATELISAFISIKFLIRINRLDKAFEERKEYPNEYKHLMKKEEFRETGKGNRKIVEEGFKDRIYYNVKRILVILIIISIVLFFFEKLLYKKEKNNSVPPGSHECCLP